jgi:uncharacterized protein YbcI
MGKFRSAIAQQVVQAASAFEQRRTDNHIPKSVAAQSRRSIGQRIAHAASAFEKRRTKHGRKWVAVFMNEDTIVIALHGSLTATEKAQVQSPTGAARVREFHRQMFTDASAVLHRKIRSITGMEVRDTAAEIESKTGHVVHLFTTDTVGDDFLSERPRSALPATVRSASTKVASSAKPMKTLDLYATDDRPSFTERISK